MKGQIVTLHANEYFAENESGSYRLTARGRMKGKTDILVGDYVEFANGAIEKVYPRTSEFIRPSVANVTQIVAVLSSEPKPDFYMLDKLLVSANKEGVSVVLAVNKNDLGAEIYDKVKSEYAASGAEILSVSAAKGDNLAALKEKLRGKLTALAGQSAVGKSSLVNAMFSTSLKVGDLSAIKRGKHTTTASHIYSFGEYRIVDTPGFAVLETDVEAEDIRFYYPEFETPSALCKFRGCTHVSEPSCEVKRLAESGEIPQKRYLRYVELFKKAKEKRRDYE